MYIIKQDLKIRASAVPDESPVGASPSSSLPRNVVSLDNIILSIRIISQSIVLHTLLVCSRPKHPVCVKRVWSQVLQ